MLSIQKIWAFGLTVVIFIFLPPENWDYWLFWGKSDRYAEICFRGDKQCYVIAKNLLNDTVDVSSLGAKVAWVSRIDTRRLERLKVGEPLPPNSYVLLEVEPKALDSSIMTRTIGSGHLLKPKALSLVAPIEEDRWTLFVLALVIASAGLMYSVGGLIKEDTRQREDRKKGS